MRTPYSFALQTTLTNELHRMKNEWFAKWHQIKSERGMQVDGFDGRKINYGGLEFWGSPRETYWSTLKRYVEIKINEIFIDAEEKIRTYPFQEALDAIEDVKN